MDGPKVKLVHWFLLSYSPDLKHNNSQGVIIQNKCQGRCGRPIAAESCGGQAAGTARDTLTRWEPQIARGLPMRANTTLIGWPCSGSCCRRSSRTASTPCRARSSTPPALSYKTSDNSRGTTLPPRRAGTRPWSPKEVKAAAFCLAMPAALCRLAHQAPGCIVKQRDCNIRAVERRPLYLLPATTRRSDCRFSRS